MAQGASGRMGGGGLAENHLKQGKQMKEVGGRGEVRSVASDFNTRPEKKKSSAFNIHHTTGVVASTLRVCVCVSVCVVKLGRGKGTGGAAKLFKAVHGHPLKHVISI